MLKGTEGQWTEAGSCCTVHPYCVALTLLLGTVTLAHAVLMAHDKCQRAQNHTPLALCSSRMGDFPGHWRRSHHGSTIRCDSSEHCCVPAAMPGTACSLEYLFWVSAGPGSSLSPTGLWWYVCCVLFRTVQQRQNSLISRARY